MMWSRCHNVWEVPGYAEVRAVLGDCSSCSPATGTAMDGGGNRLRARNIIRTDPSEHEALRDVLAAQLSAWALGVLHHDVEARLEGQIVLSVLARTVSDIQVVRVERKRNSGPRGFGDLQVELG